MKTIAASIITIIGFLAFAPGTSTAQLIVYGTAYKKMEEKGCGMFLTGAGFQFKNFGSTVVDRKAVQVAFKSEMINAYGNATVLVRGEAVPHGFLITVNKDEAPLPCSRRIYYTGFGKTMHEAIELAEKAVKTFCRGCTTISRSQL